MSSTSARARRWYGAALAEGNVYITAAVDRHAREDLGVAALTLANIFGVWMFAAINQKCRPVRRQTQLTIPNVFTQKKDQCRFQRFASLIRSALTTVILPLNFDEFFSRQMQANPIKRAKRGPRRDTCGGAPFKNI